MRKNGPNLLRLASAAMLLAAVALFFVELLGYSRARSRNPVTMTIGGVPVGGLSQTEAMERLLQIYSTDVELLYGDHTIRLNPASVGFRLDTEVMLAAAEMGRSGADFWGGFWNYLWNRPGDPIAIPLRSEFSSNQLNEALRDIATRYDEPATPAEPIPGRSQFTAGNPGRVLDISRSAELIAEIMNSPTNRRVNLPVVSTAPLRPTMTTLEILVKQIMDVSGFDGLAVVYVRDLRTGEEFHFAHYRGEDIATEPDIAFTAASVNKIGIMTAYYRYFDPPFDEEIARWVKQMITESGNDPADWLMDRMETVGDLPGPLMVTETLHEDLGLENTFIVGFYRPSNPLRLIRTPGNQRADISTRPDVYNQTSTADMGMLLTDIYACSQGGGTLLAVFPDEISPSECKEMLSILSENYLGSLIQAGVPDGTRVAHKHGYTSSPLDMVCDAGIVYSPGGNYMISLFLWNDPEMIWEPTSRLVADISKSVYNYFNLPVTP